MQRKGYQTEGDVIWKIFKRFLGFMNHVENRTVEADEEEQAIDSDFKMEFDSSDEEGREMEQSRVLEERAKHRHCAKNDGSVLMRSALSRRVFSSLLRPCRSLTTASSDNGAQSNFNADEETPEELNTPPEGDGKTEPADADNRPKDRNRFDYNSETLKELGFDAFPYYIERAWWKEGYRMTFWSHWDMLRDIKRRRTVAEWGPLRMRYKALKTNNILPQAIINEFQERMNKMPRRANPNLVIQMCQFTARRRGKLNKFRLNRHIFRQITDRGELSGTQRASW
uniref:Ribosomal protein S14p/S29e n=1 Tax=Globodera pallida TaxID=36090 RepID=A0A183BSH5_GLOPA